MRRAGVQWWRAALALAFLNAACGTPGAAPDSGDSQGSAPAAATGWSALELRLHSLGLSTAGAEATAPGARALGDGAPLLLEVVVDNLEAVRAVNARGGSRPGEGEEPLPTVALDGAEAWEERVTFAVTDAGGAAVLEGYAWRDALQGGPAAAAERSAGFEVQRATWIVSPTDLSGLAGDLTITATLASPDGSDDPLVSAPLVVAVAAAGAAPTATARYGEAKAHELRGDWQAAIDAAQEALALDPQMFDAMEVVANGYLQLGDTAAAIDWYERYIDTFPSDDARDGYPKILRAFVASLREQQ